MSEPSEHRVASRVPVDLHVEIRKNGQVFPGAVVNCSLSGVFLRTSWNLQRGELIELWIKLPDSVDPIVIESRVIWTDWHESKGVQGFGIHFFSLTEEQTKRLGTFLERL